jgi:hypothetical protein
MIVRQIFFLNLSFPVNFTNISEQESKLRIENGFMISEYYKLEFKDDDFIIDADIICLKVSYFCILQNRIK